MIDVHKKLNSEEALRFGFRLLGFGVWALRAVGQMVILSFPGKNQLMPNIPPTRAYIYICIYIYVCIYIHTHILMHGGAPRIYIYTYIKYIHVCV